MQLFSQGDLQPHLRSGAIKLLARVEGLDSREKSAIANAYWESCIRYHIGQQDYEGAYHRIFVAALGTQAFEGIDRVCRGHVDNEPVGLVATPEGVMGLIHLLYYAMSHSPIQRELDIDDRRSKAWGPLFKDSNRLTEMMQQQRGVVYAVAAIQVTAIAYWTNNRRRYASEAA